VYLHLPQTINQNKGNTTTNRKTTTEEARMVILAVKVIADRGVLVTTDRENLDQEIESIEDREAQDLGICNFVDFHSEFMT
jgi:hypothetical protein